ncbi:hypothetical protein GW17_00014511 [Ensete ventricosum]|nr:hypothetical protein GW17_00014511 [Ensete ventricosum]
MDKVSAFGELLKIGRAEVSRKMKDGMSSMSFKIKELFHSQNQNEAEKIVEEATSEKLDGPDWSANLMICDMVNSDNDNGIEFIRGIKKRIMSKNPSRVQYLALLLLETCVKNCEMAFSVVAAERVLDEMVKLIANPQDCIHFPGRDSESIAPVFTPRHSVSETEAYDSIAQQTDDVPMGNFTAEQIKEVFDVARNSDDLSNTLFQQCRQSQYTIQSIIEAAGDDEAVLFEALNVNDELQRVLSKYEELKKPPVVPSEPTPNMIPIVVEPEESPRAGSEDALIRKPAGSRTKQDRYGNILYDLDETIFGMENGSTSENQEPKKKQQQNDDQKSS